MLTVVLSLRPTRFARRAYRGFTLFEAMLASVILAFGMAGVSGVVMASYGLTRQMREDSTALSLAQQLMDEIVARPFAPGTNAGWSGGVSDRTRYDSVGDYNNFTDATATLTGGAGSVTLAAPGTYTRLVTVTTPGSIAGMTTPSDAKFVVIAVTEPCGKRISLTRLVTAADLQRVQTP